MLTVILLVVLAGGAGLLAVWSVDPGSLRRFAGRAGSRSLRASRDGDTATEAVPTAAEVVAAPASLEAPTAAAPTFAPIAAPSLAGPVRRRRRGSVPRGFTAVEGDYRDVAVSPLWRRALSLALLLVVLVVIGVAFAAVAAAVLGAAAELVNGAVG